MSNWSTVLWLECLSSSRTLLNIWILEKVGAASETGAHCDTTNAMIGRITHLTGMQLLFLCSSFPLIFRFKKRHLALMSWNKILVYGADYQNHSSLVYYTIKKILPPGFGAVASKPGAYQFIIVHLSLVIIHNMWSTSCLIILRIIINYFFVSSL